MLGIARQVFVALGFGRADEKRRAERIQATTDVDNRAMRTVLDRLGFGFEGVTGAATRNELMDRVVDYLLR